MFLIRNLYLGHPVHRLLLAREFEHAQGTILEDCGNRRLVGAGLTWRRIASSVALRSMHSRVRNVSLDLRPGSSFYDEARRTQAQIYQQLRRIRDRMKTEAAKIRVGQCA